MKSLHDLKVSRKALHCGADEAANNNIVKLLSTAVGVPSWELDRDLTGEGDGRHLASRRRRISRCIGRSGYFGCFEAVNHEILLERLNTAFGIDGLPLQ